MLIWLIKLIMLTALSSPLCVFVYADSTTTSYVDASDARTLKNILDNTRWALHISTRLNRNFETGNWSSLESYGFDSHKVVSDESRDYSRLIFQPYVVNLNNVKNDPTKKSNIFLIH